MSCGTSTAHYAVGQFTVGQRVKVNYTPAPNWSGEGVVRYIDSDGSVSVKMETGNFAGSQGAFVPTYLSVAEPEAQPAAVTVGLGGAPTRATTLPATAAERKQYPVATGVLDYFPDALAAISNVSYRGNQQHNPGKPLHWDRNKSADEADTMIRHFLQRGTLDTDGVPHSAKMAWRALALLQKELEASSNTPKS
jgi:hypothetical protein